LDEKAEAETTNKEMAKTIALEKSLQAQEKKLARARQPPQGRPSNK
jgi:hypothetical protein